MKAGLRSLLPGTNTFPALKHAFVGGAIYWLVASLSLSLAVPGSIISPLWPPAAWALFACLTWGKAIAPAIWLGATFAFLLPGWALLPAALAGAAAALAAWSACAMIERLQRHQGDFMYNGNLFRFVLIAAIASLLSAPLAVGGALLAERLGPQLWLGWLTWFAGTTAGVVIFTPLLRTWRLHGFGEWPDLKKAEALLFMALLPTITYIAFSGASEAWSFSYLPLPFMIWAAYRFHLAAIAWSTALVCVMAVWGTLRGTGPFAHADHNTALLLVAAYVSVIGIIGLTLSSLIHQRAGAEAKLTEERDQLEQRVLARTEALHAELHARQRIERQLAEAQRVAQVGSWNWDLASGEIVWSEQLYRLYGVDRAHGPIRPREYMNMLHKDDVNPLIDTFQRCRRTGETFLLEHRIELDGAGTRVLQAKGQGELGAKGDVVRMFGTVQDITEMRRAEAALQEARERYRLVVETSPDAILVLQDERIVFINPAALALLGVGAAQQVIDRSAFDFLHPECRDLLASRVADLENGRHPDAAECKLTRADQKEIEVEVSSSPFLHLGKPAALHILRDITERKRSATQLAYLAHHDTLTGLPNRTAFNQRLEHALNVAARPGRTLELLFLDLDQFKQINDTLGHAGGDQVLKETARRLCASLRESDTVARLAGDEFVVLIENVDEPQRGATIAEKILTAFAPPFLVGSTSLHVGTSIGITAYPDDGVEAATLLKRADMAMYRGKQQGRNRYCYYSPRLNAQSVERRALEQALRLALEHGELTMHYQPRIEVASGRMNGMEALLRWRHPELGQVAPSQIIPMAEEYGLIKKLGYWTLREACRQAQAWQHEWPEAQAGDRPVRRYQGFHVAVNLTARQLSDPLLPTQLEMILDETGLAARHLEIEITEDALLAEPEQVLRALRALRAIGVGVTIDDFGIGYSSLAHLQRCPIAAVKIGRAFVRGIPSNQGDAAVIRAIIGLAHSLGCVVVAQGAETREQVDFLRDHACDSMQGYYFGEPMPAAMFQQHMQAGWNSHLH